MAQDSNGYAIIPTGGANDYGNALEHLYNLITAASISLTTYDDAPPVFDGLHPALKALILRCFEDGRDDPSARAKGKPRRRGSPDDSR